MVGLYLINQDGMRAMLWGACLLVYSGIGWVSDSLAEMIDEVGKDLCNRLDRIEARIDRA